MNKEIVKNPMAKALACPSLRPRIVKPKKGPGSYSRKNNRP